MDRLAAEPSARLTEAAHSPASQGALSARRRGLSNTVLPDTEGTMPLRTVASP